jgi:hypothetical protein
MLNRIRKNYLRFIVPIALLFLFGAAALLMYTRFGIVYAFKKPVPLSSLSENDMAGSYASVKVDELGDTFSFYGYTDDNEERVVLERYNVYVVGNRFLTVRATGDAVKALENYDNTKSLIEEGKIGSILEANIGTLVGTINDNLNSEVYNLLGKYIVDKYLDNRTSEDPLKEALITALNIPVDTDEDIDYTVYYKDLIIPLQLEAGYYGYYPSTQVLILSGIALFFLLVFTAFIISIVIGLWEKPLREFLREYGRTALEDDYKISTQYKKTMSLGNKFVWYFKALKSEIINIDNIIWVYPRSRRLEGGKHTWYLVIKTDKGQEYSIHLDETSVVQAAIDNIAKGDRVLTVGYDKEKQKLYERDIATFKARVRNKTI